MSARLDETELINRIDELHKRSKRCLVDYVIILEMNIRSMSDVINTFLKKTKPEGEEP